MQNTPEAIHIMWEGPHPYASMPQFVNSDIDFGVYAIYGSHTLHGNNSLLYIGRAMRGSFGWRFPKPELGLDGEGFGDLTVYLGRFAGPETPTHPIWDRQIELAESLMIYAHKPPLNTRISPGSLESALEKIHVCNWGSTATIYPELTGLRWTSKGETIQKKIYRATP